MWSRNKTIPSKTSWGVIGVLSHLHVLGGYTEDLAKTTEMPNFGGVDTCNANVSPCYLRNAKFWGVGTCSANVSPCYLRNAKFWGVGTCSAYTTFHTAHVIACPLYIIHYSLLHKLWSSVWKLSMFLYMLITRDYPNIIFWLGKDWQCWNSARESKRQAQRESRLSKGDDGDYCTIDSCVAYLLVLCVICVGAIKCCVIISDPIYIAVHNTDNNILHAFFF